MTRTAPLRQQAASVRLSSRHASRKRPRAAQGKSHEAAIKLTETPKALELLSRLAGGRAR
jgi:hypothetical protein